eukprot:TRINITY_DN7216_c0_g1_i1.p1 TRINITY_DN7216_c0_g1~~TRINITY_DN7216_c0_g1_i1.p1  ORF type:complete len:1330 (-),score=298.35 TRINITY_DN7216_c0_g1_i1:346-4335(-)
MSSGDAAVFEALPIATFVINSGGDITDSNLAAGSLCNVRNKADLCKKKFIEALVASEDQSEARVRLTEALEGAGAEGRPVKVNIVTRSGRKQVVFRMATKRRDGKLDGAVVTAQELAEVRQLAGEAVGSTSNAAGRSLSGALEGSLVPTFCVDKEGRIVEWTSKLEKTSGLSKAQTLGLDFSSQCVCEPFQRATRKAVDQALRGLEISRFKVELPRQVGSTHDKDAWLRFAPWRSDDGTIIGAVGMCEDATEMDQLLAQAEWLKQSTFELLECCNALVFSIDESLNCLEVNRRMKLMIGKDRDEIAGKSAFSLFEDKDKAELQRAADIAVGGELGACIQLVLKPNINVVLGMSPLFNFSGKVVGALAVMHVYVCPTAQPRESDAPSLESAVSKTKAMVMHEMRSPLHGIIGLSNTLSQDKSSFQKPLQLMGHSAERVLDLITNLMDYWSWLDTPPNTYEEMVDLAVLAREVVAKSSTLKNRQGKPLKKDKVNLTHELESISVQGDPQGLTQVLHQLLNNSLKFTQEGVVKLSVFGQDNNAIIQIEDAGIGIKEDSFDRMFKPFEQEDASESRRYDGIGIGLAIVHEVVRIHRGSYKVQAAQPKGTIIRITLPCSFSPDEVATQSSPLDKHEVKPLKVPMPASLPKSAESNWIGQPSSLGLSLLNKMAIINGRESLGSRTAASLPSVMEGVQFTESEDKLILSVDDDFVNQEVMRSILEPTGFTVTACMNGSECLEYIDGAQNAKPKVILLDLMMPGLSGFDVLQTLRKQYSPAELPIIMVSAKNQSSSVVKGYELGCNDWVHKPFCSQELIARINLHMRFREMFVACRGPAALEAHQPDEVCKSLSTPGSSAPVSLNQLPVIPSREQPTPDSTPNDATVLVATVNCQTAGDEELLPLFEAFQKLVDEYNPLRADFVGGSLILVANAADKTNHADKMLGLAVRLQGAAVQLNNALPVSIGLHTEAGKVHCSIKSSKGFQQYPASSFFSSTVRKAKLLSEAAADDYILLSHDTKSWLTANTDAELARMNVTMQAGSASNSIGPFYFIAKPGVASAGSSPLRAARIAAPAPAPAPAAPAASVGLSDGPRLAELQLELQKAHQACKVLTLQHREAEEKVLKLQFKMSDQAAARKDGAASSHTPGSTRSEKPNASTVFLQWQNAHLQAELRHSQQALLNTKAELQMQVMACQFLESKHSQLQARMEHLELDLSFNAARSSASDHGDMPVWHSSSTADLPPYGSTGLSAHSPCGIGHGMMPGSAGQLVGMHGMHNVPSAGFGDALLAGMDTADVPGSRMPGRTPGPPAGAGCMVPDLATHTLPGASSGFPTRMRH